MKGVFAVLERLNKHYVLKIFLTVFFASFLTFSASGQTPSDRQMAIDSLKIIGADVAGSSKRCANCHSLNSQEIEKWGAAARSTWNCVKRYQEGETPQPELAINCLKTDGKFTSKKIGLLSGAVELPYFVQIFKDAYGAGGYEDHYKKFMEKVRMPKDGKNMFTEEQVAVFKPWVEKDLPDLEIVLREASEVPVACKPEIDHARLNQHLAQMRTRGWSAVNRSQGLLHFDCQDNRNPFSCLTSQRPSGGDWFVETDELAEAKTWKHQFPLSKMRVLHSWTNRSAYWIRSSPDGRFIGMGLYGSRTLPGVRDPQGNPIRFNGSILDLKRIQQEARSPEILINSPFDPAFFADNSGFNYAGGNFCPMSLLKYPDRSHVLFSEPGCVQAGKIGLYQSIGSVLQGSGEHLAISGIFAGDFGNTESRYDPTRPPFDPENFRFDPVPRWLARSYLKIFPIQYNGFEFEVKDPQEVHTPYSADYVLSPSSKLIVSRTSGYDRQKELKQQGYKIHLIERDMVRDEYKVNEIANLCLKGGKASFSYDERFLVYHHRLDLEDYKEYGFTDPKSPKFAELLAQGVSNIYLYDLLTHQQIKVTHLQAGQFAFFPHFRNDGWLIFLVKDEKTKREYFVASNIALYVH